MRPPPSPPGRHAQLPADKTPDDLYAALNLVRDPSMIRVESDELTYSMHIILRCAWAGLAVAALLPSWLRWLGWVTPVWQADAAAAADALCVCGFAGRWRR